MRSTETLSIRYSDEMGIACKAEDPVAFTQAAVSLREVALKAIAEGFHAAGAKALMRLSIGLQEVVVVRPDKPGYGGKSSVDFVSAVMPLFGVNSPEVSNNLGVSPEIDDYLVKNKVNFDELAFDHLSSVFTFYGVKHGLVDEFITGYGGLCGDLLQRQQNEYEISGSETGDCYNLNTQYTLIRVFERMSHEGLPVPALPDEVDEMLSSALTNLCVGSAASFKSAQYEAMHAAGLHRSINAALMNTSRPEFNLDQVELQGLSLVQATYILGLNCNRFHGPNLVRNLLKYSPERVDTAMHPMSYKQSICNPENLMKSCADFIKSPDYRPEHFDVVRVLLENAFEKVKKHHKFKKNERDFEVYRVKLNDAGIPDHFQFQLPMIRDAKGKILEIEMGL